MMDTAQMSLRTNAQHRMDQTIGTWQASGTGLKRVHTSYSGWTIRKTRDGYYWQVFRPDGTQYQPYPRGMANAWKSLATAKNEANEGGAQS